MGNFLTAQICENGHIITSDIEKFSYSFCPQCGSKAFDKCSSCGKPIHGSYYEYDILFVPEPLDQKPFYCYHCGKPYPWTQKILDSAIELLSLDEDLDSELSFFNTQQLHTGLNFAPHFTQYIFLFSFLKNY